MSDDNECDSVKMKRNETHRNITLPLELCPHDDYHARERLLE